MHNTTRTWVLRGLVALVLGSSAGVARPADDVALGSVRVQPPAARTSADYLSGSEWVLDAAGALVRTERVAVVLDIDKAHRVVRQVVMAENPGSTTEKRVTTFAITTMKREGPVLSLTAVADDGGGVTHTLQVSSRGGKAWAHELWTTTDGKVTRSVVRVATRIARLEVDQTMASLVDSLESQSWSGR